MYHTWGKDQSAELWYISDIARHVVVASIYGVTSHIQACIAVDESE